MSCSLHKAWLDAEKAMKNMFVVGFEHEGKYPEKYDTDYRADITDIWHMYQNVRRIRLNMVANIPEGYVHEEEESSDDTVHIEIGSDDGTVTLPDGCYDPDGNISVTLGDAITSIGGDAITWNNEVFNEPVTFNTDDLQFSTDTLAPPQATQSGDLPPTTPVPRTTNPLENTPVDPERMLRNLITGTETK